MEVTFESLLHFMSEDVWLFALKGSIVYIKKFQLNLISALYGHLIVQQLH